MKSLILSPFRLDWPSRLKTGDEASWPTCTEVIAASIGCLIPQ